MDRRVKCKGCGYEYHKGDSRLVYFMLTPSNDGAVAYRICSRCLAEYGSVSSANGKKEFWKRFQLNKEEIEEEGIDIEFIRDREHDKGTA